MRRSSVLPLIIIIATFLVIPVAFWIINFQKSDTDIKGANTGSSGMVIKIKSEGGAWDMSKFLCVDTNECVESLTSGKILDKTSGGGIEEQEVGVGHSSNLEQYKYVKIFAEPGWGSADRVFSVSMNEALSDSFTHEFEVGSVVYKAAIFSISDLESNIMDAAVFSDR